MAKSTNNQSDYSCDEDIIEKMRLLDENSALKTQQIQNWRWIAKTLLFVSVGLIICLIITVMAYRNQRTVPIGITPGGVVIKITPLSENSVKIPTVVNVAKEAFVDVNWISFVNTESHIESKRQWFDGVSGGFSSWRESVSKVKLVERIKANSETTSAVLLTSPVISWSGNHPNLKNTFAWKVQFTALVSYAGIKGTATQTVNVEMLMRRVPETERLEGVAVEAIITT